jgi:hypothetical protein
LNNTTASNNTAVGYQALYSNTTGTPNTAVGYQAGYSVTTNGPITALGYQAGKSYNAADDWGSVFVGYLAGTVSTGKDNIVVGGSALAANTSGAFNTAIGAAALKLNTTASENTAVGYQALYTNTTGAVNVAVGKNALQNSNSSYNTAVGGGGALYSVTSGAYNTAVGFGSGYLITTGSKNSILGAYTGNQGGLDIRTASNYIVLSDGDGNPRMYIDSNGGITQSATGATIVSVGVYNQTSGSASNLGVASNGIIYRSTSSLKYKKNVADATHGLTDLLKLRSVTYKGKGENDGETVFGGLIAEEVHAVGLTEFVQYAEDGSPDALAYGNMVSLCVKSIQELKTIVDTQAAEIAELKTKVA